MKIRTCAALFLTAGIAATLPTMALAVDFPEVEPNETKATATPALGLLAGDTLSGTTTGSLSSGTTLATRDTFRVGTAAAPLGIYRHRLAITTTGTAGHTGNVLGLTISGGAPATSEATIQSSTSTTTPARVNQWYGFGRSEQIFYRVTGGTTTTAPYLATYSVDPVVPATFATNPEAGAITIARAGESTVDGLDRDAFLFDSNLNPIAGIDDPDTQALARTLAAGTYYVAYGRFNVAAGLATGPSIIQGTGTGGNVMDFADVVATSVSGSSTVPITLNITSPAGTTSASAPLLGAFDVAWFQFTVVPASTPTNPIITSASGSPATVNAGSILTITANVAPGAVPTSTFTGALSGITITSPLLTGGVALIRDNGIFPDAVAGDNIFTGGASISISAPTGSATLPLIATDDQGRSSAVFNLTTNILGAIPGCPTALETATFTAQNSEGSLGSALNGVATANFTVPGQVNTLRATGRLTSSAVFNLEARIQATAPDGTNYQLQPFTTTPSTAVRDLNSFTFTLPTLEDGTGTWTFRFYESIDDGANPDAVWTQICFGLDAVSTNPTATDTATPATVARDGAQQVTLAVTVVPGQFPTSSDLAVVVNDSSIGGSGALALLDNGVAPDVLAGDNIFTGAAVVAPSTALGGATLPYTVTDAQGRNAGTGLTLNFTVAEAIGACCLPDGSCVVTNINNCVTTLEGTFAGTGTACNAYSAFTTDGAGAFEDISSTGTRLTALDSEDDETTTVTLPFTFNFYGNPFTSVRVITNGYLSFSGTDFAFGNGPIPSTGTPNNAIYALWDDLNFFSLTGGAAFTETRGTPGVDQRFIVQWNNVGQYNGFATAPTDASTFQAVLFEDGAIELRYLTVSGEAGTEGATGTTTFGIENAAGTNATVLNETRATLTGPISYRTIFADTGVCVPACPVCPADFDNDGGVTGADVEAFFAAFESGDLCADTDLDGGVTGADVEAFFLAFENGGC
jgi:hypothetical protein